MEGRTSQRTVAKRCRARAFCLGRLKESPCLLTTWQIPFFASYAPKGVSLYPADKVRATLTGLEACAVPSA